MVIEYSHKFADLVQICKDSNAIVIPICTDHRVHPRVSNLQGIYISMLDNMQKCYIPINHTDALKNFNFDSVLDLIRSMKNIYVLDSKEFYHLFNTIEHVYDCNAISYHLTGSKLNIENTQAHKFMYSMYWELNNVNTIIPIHKHIEYCQKIEKNIKELDLSIIKNTDYNSFNCVFLNNLMNIESSGLYTSKGFSYCNYNPYTRTGRPSNKFNKTNYSALNKSDGTRTKYISRFKDGGIIELDYDAYHLRLIGDLIGYELPKASVHEYLGKQYFGKDKLTPDEYNQSKEISFRILYGGIPKEFLSIPFFRKVNDFIFEFWQKWCTKKYYKTYLYNRIVHEKVIGEMTPQKLFNYYIQSMETEVNSESMTRVFSVLKKYKSKFILYTYDSFTFDFNLDDGKDFILQIKRAMKYPTRISFGTNYGDLNDVSSRFS